MFDYIRFEDNLSDSLSHLEVYANAHVLRLDDSHPKYMKVKSLLERIQNKFSPEVTKRDMEIYDKFRGNILKIARRAVERGCVLYIDAE